MRHPRSRLARRWATAGLLAAAAAAPGCEVAGLGAHVVAGGERTVRVKAAYDGLAERSAAVLVSVPETARGRHPDAPDRIAARVTRRLRENVPGIEALSAERTARFRRENPYWMVQPPRRLLDRLGVERLVIVDLLTYRLHEKGNRHVWLGRAVARVSVAEAESSAAGAAFETTVRARFPPDTSVGLVDADPSRIRAGLHELFGRRVAQLFHDHRARAGEESA